MTIRNIFLEIAKVAGIGLILRVLIGALFGVPYESLSKDAALDATIVIVSSALVTAERLTRLWSVIRTLLAFFEKTNRSFRKPAIEFLRKGVATLAEMIPSVFSFDGVKLSTLEVGFISQLCFRFGRGVYHGTDSNVPSVFKKKYPLYLSYHEENAKKRAQPGIRILLVSESSLMQDFKSHRNDFETFYGWHGQNAIALLQVDPHTARGVAEAFEIPSTDIGIWDSTYAGIFKEEDDRIRLIMRSNGSESFDKCQKYFLELLTHTKEVRIINAKLELRDRELRYKEDDQNTVKAQWAE